MSEVTAKKLVGEYKSQGPLFKQVESEILEGFAKKDYAAGCIFDPSGALSFEDFKYWVENRLGMKIIGKIRIETRIIVED